MTEILFNQYADEWNLTEDDINKAVELYKFDFGTKRKRQDPSKPRLFLYAKALLNDRTSAFRTIAYDDLLAGRTKTDADALERLTTIVEKGETTPLRSTFERSSLFKDFVSEHSEWSQEKSFVVFRDHPSLKDKPHALVERFQKSGLCYMHAGVVLQHYLVAIHKEEKVPMLDLAKYLRQHMPKNALYDQIWDDCGEVDISQLLNQYGPGLVSGFKVTKDFASDKCWQHLGRYDNSELHGRHAMVIVGWRSEGGKNRYLLQNWWKKKSYVEVDSECLYFSRSAIHFIKCTQTQMGDVPISHEKLIECDPGLDAPENFIPET